MVITKSQNCRYHSLGYILIDFLVVILVWSLNPLMFLISFSKPKYFNYCTIVPWLYLWFMHKQLCEKVYCLIVSHNKKNLFWNAKHDFVFCKNPVHRWLYSMHSYAWFLTYVINLKHSWYFNSFNLLKNLNYQLKASSQLSLFLNSDSYLHYFLVKCFLE